MKIIVFVLGYKTIKLGYTLISSGVKGEFKFSSSFSGFKADLASVSPGLLFVLLGILLIMVAIYVEKSVSLEKHQSEHALPKSQVDSLLLPPNPFDSLQSKNN